MKKRTLLIIILLFALVLGACQKTQSPSDPAKTGEATKAPQGPTKAPTHTPRYLGPLYQTKIFLGGEGWAMNVDKTQYYRTTNFGEHWVTATPPDLGKHLKNYPLITPYFTSGRVAFILMSRPEEKSVLFTSKDGGETWENIELDFPGGHLNFINSNEGFILSSLGVGAGSEYVAVQHTTDGGKTWQTVFTHEPGQAAEGLPSSGIKNGITFMDDKVGFITGSAPISESLYLYRTKDGGVNWEQQSCENIPVFGESDIWEPSAVRRVSPTTAFVAIKTYIAERETTVTHWCKTLDTGETWQYVSTRDEIEFSDFGSATFGLAFGKDTLIRTTDGGVTWDDYTDITCPSMKPVTFQAVSDALAYMICSSNAPEDLIALNQNRLFVSMTQGRRWQSMEASIIK